MTDLHIHTTYCDGKNSPEEIVSEAVKKGMKCIGFSAHSYTFFDESYCMKKENYSAYRSEIDFLKEKYASEIKILCGIEQDFYSDMPTDGFDYTIGSVHYVKKCGEYIPVDENAEILQNAVEKYYGGDFISLAEDYFETVEKLHGGTDIIGHFDLISKFNENKRLFDESNPRYISAYKKAIDALALKNIPFEVNTGAISRGYKKSAYPSIKQLEYIKEKGGRVILSSDSHSKDTLCFGFEEEKKKLLKMGFEI